MTHAETALLKSRLRAEARELQAYGLSNVEIAERLGTTPRRISDWLSPVSVDRDLSLAEGRYRGRLMAETVTDQVTPEDYAARLAEIPKTDTRSLIGRIVGDPLPGRSALDRKRNGETAVNDSARRSSRHRPSLQ
jgi:hypothetical protein